MKEKFLELLKVSVAVTGQPFDTQQQGKKGCGRALISVDPSR